MATYGGTVDLILTELARADTSITAVVEREVLKAIEFYTPERFWFNEARVSFTASSTIFYPLTSLTPLLNVIEVDQLSATVGGAVRILKQKSPQELNEIDSSGATGPPSMWAMFGEQFRLYPKPATGTTYQVDVDGTKRLTTLSASTDSNAWTTYGVDLIAARVEKHLCQRKFKDLERASAYAESEREELQRLRDRSTRLLSSGKLSPGY